MNWIYIIIAAVFEAAWTFSLKFFTFADLKKLRFDNFYSTTEGLPILLPFIGYIVFGIGNIYFFSAAMKTIPTATAFAVWTSISIIFIKVAEILFFQQKISAAEIFFMAMITVGIIGMKNFSAP